MLSILGCRRQGMAACPVGPALSGLAILVEFEKPTFDNFMNLAFFLEDLLQRKVDLVTPNSLSPYIGPYVKNEVVWAE
jgi:uncharacterized protein